MDAPLLGADKCAAELNRISSCLGSAVNIAAAVCVGKTADDKIFFILNDGTLMLHTGMYYLTDPASIVLHMVFKGGIALSRAIIEELYQAIIKQHIITLHIVAMLCAEYTMRQRTQNQLDDANVLSDALSTGLVIMSMNDV